MTNDKPTMQELLKATILYREDDIPRPPWAERVEALLAACSKVGMISSDKVREILDGDFE